MKFLTKISLLVYFCLSANGSQPLIDSQSDCSANIVESIPIGLSFATEITSISTFDGLISLITTAEHSIEIASFYWSLLGSHVTSGKGRLLFNAIIESAKTGVSIRIVVSDDKLRISDSEDIPILSEFADVRRLNMRRLVGVGTFHTKFIIVDNKHLYIGSANMDWRSLTQVKELGVVINHCQPIVEDLNKIFDIYWHLGRPETRIPYSWPKSVSTPYNTTLPLLISLNRIKYNLFLSSSPKLFCAEGRTDDIDAILFAIRSAKKYVYISVMDYYPMFIFTKDKLFWPVIDDALREAVIQRKVSIRLMASHWNSTLKSMPLFLKSLSAFSDREVFGADIEVKLFVVPAFTRSQAAIPHARVNHNKFMVTDKSAYIGTNNWSADYFVNTGGVGITMTPTQNAQDLRLNLLSIFERDWNSIYAKHV